jgi:hypothetical protein
MAFAKPPYPEIDWTTINNICHDPQRIAFCQSLNLRCLERIAEGMRSQFRDAGGYCFASHRACGGKHAQRSGKVQLSGQGYNLVLDLAFSDGVIWLARVPLLNACFMADDCTRSEANILKFLKKYTSIRVPEIYCYYLQSDPRNKMGVPFMIMECLPGQTLASIASWRPEMLDNEDAARKLHEQITDIMIELGSFGAWGVGKRADQSPAAATSEEIGSFLVDAEGSFTMTELVLPAINSGREERMRQ